MDLCDIRAAYSQSMTSAIAKTRLLQSHLPADIGPQLSDAIRELIELSDKWESRSDFEPVEFREITDAIGVLSRVRRKSIELLAIQAARAGQADCPQIADMRAGLSRFEQLPELLAKEFEIQRGLSNGSNN